MLTLQTYIIPGYGMVHILKTHMTWDERQQQNMYLAGHLVGYDGTGSRVIFYNLDQLSEGDSIVLKDCLANAYNYLWARCWLPSQMRGGSWTLCVIATCLPSRPARILPSRTVLSLELIALRLAPWVDSRVGHSGRFLQA